MGKTYFLKNSGATTSDPFKNFGCKHPLRHSLFLLVATILLLLPGTITTFAAEANVLHWQNWSDSVFEQAKKEKRFILLDLEAVWCHWCHVMNDETYGNPQIQKLIAERYIPVRVDQDARPDLSNRYEDYGWPATIVFDAQGHEIIKRSGFIPPRQMASVLQAIIDDPTPGPSVHKEVPLEPAQHPSLPPGLEKELEASYADGYDSDNGSWGFVKKFMAWDCVEYALLKARLGDPRAEKMARQTLSAQKALLDPIWGGIYQYSTNGDWKHPHFEKIMSMQAGNLRIYSLAYAEWGNPQDLRVARAIESYLKNFLLSSSGSFYTT